MLLTAGIAGCSSGPPPDEGPHAAVVIGMPAAVDSWNPYTTNEATSAGLLELIYPRLVLETAIGGGASAFRPWLARSWEFSEDRLSLTFRLREDARWSDDRPVTCDDVRFTHAIQVDDALAWSGAFIKDRIAGVECPDPHTAVFRFKESYAGQLLDANDDAIVPAAYGEVPLDAWLSTPWEERIVGCGPYMVRSVTAGQEAVLERNDRWWVARDTAIRRVVLRIYPDSATILPRLLDGEIDMLPAVPPMRAGEVAAREDLRLVVLPSLAYTYIGWNALEPGAYGEDRRRRDCYGEGGCEETTADIARLLRERPHPALSDGSVRRALDLAIDRRDLVDGLYAGYARPGSSPIPSALWAHVPVADEYDPKRAATLLDDAGWRDLDRDGVRERAGRALEIRALVNSDNRLRNDALERIGAGMERIGVRWIVESVPRGEFVARARDKDFDAVISGWWAGTRIEPQNLLHTRAALDRGNNLVSWSDERSDSLLDQAAAATTREAALPLWHAWQQRFSEEQPLSILFEEQRLIGFSSRVIAEDLSFLNPFQNLHEWSVVDETDAGD